MFAPYCHRHGTRVLLPTSAITALINGPDGIAAEFLCHCGARGVWTAANDLVSKTDPLVLRSAFGHA